MNKEHTVKEVIEFIDELVYPDINYKINIYNDNNNNFVCEIPQNNKAVLSIYLDEVVKSVEFSSLNLIKFAIIYI